MKKNGYNEKEARDWKEEFAGKHAILTKDEVQILREKYKEKYGEYPLEINDQVCGQMTHEKVGSYWIKVDGSTCKIEEG